MNISERFLLLPEETRKFYRLRLYFHNLLELPLDTLFLSDILKILDNGEVLYANDDLISLYNNEENISDIEDFITEIDVRNKTVYIRKFFREVTNDDNTYYIITKSLFSRNRFTEKEYNIIRKIELDKGNYLSDFKDI